MDKDEKQLIDKVTENNESPAPGWALDQLARLTVQKPGIESEMAELLFKRLSKNSCDVKLKTLRAMHFISRRGSSSFRRACQHGSQIIRQHLNITGNPHPVHGDAPWRFIRDTAKELMNSIHDTSRDAEPVAQLKKMEGFGGGGNSGPVDEFRNSPAGGGPSAGSGGMGNFDQRTATGAMGAVGGMLNKAKAALEQNEYAAKAMGHMQTAAQQAAGAVGFGGGQAGQQYSQAADGSVPQGGAYGGNMGTYAGGPPVGGADGGQWGQQSQPAAQPQSSMPNKIKVEAGEYEAKIIDDLCEPSGARPNPSKEVLAKFVKQCGSLDADLCCALLEEKLEDEDWKVCLKALVGIEVLVTSKKDGVVDYFDGNDELIKEISVDPESQKSLKLAAEKCLKAFEKAKAAPVVDNGMADMFSGMAMMDEPAAAPDPLGFGGGAPAAAAPAATMDLSFMGAAAAPVTLQAPAQSAAAPAAPAPAPVDPLFAGVGGAPAPAAPAPAAPAPAPAAGGFDLLSGFAAAPAAAAPAPPAAGGGDLMGMFSAPAPQQPAQMMGGMMGQPQQGMMGGMMQQQQQQQQQPMGGMGQQPMMGMMGQQQQPQMGMPMMGAPAPAPQAGAFDFLGN